MKNLKRILKIGIFILILSTIISQLNTIFIRKSLEKPWDMGNKIAGYFNEKEKYDLMFFGTSHAYCSFYPEILKKHGINSYVLASQKQPVQASYYYIKKALKISEPKKIYFDICDLITKNQLDDGTIHSYTDYFPLSFDKLAMIKNSLPKDKWAENIFPLFKYHSRWEEIAEEDLKFKWKDFHDDLKGYVMLQGQSKNFMKNPKVNLDNMKIIEAAKDKTFKEENYIWAKKIYDLCKKNKLALYFIKTPLFNFEPYKENIDAAFSYIKDFGGNVIDLSKDKEKIGLTKEDFYDPSHLNRAGAEKFTQYFYENYLK
ncbi:hypothetical protein J2S72_001507 [Peptoniphilus koenoeneniae]|uniref:DUF1574 domain-containing protein n=1 Tax=Peptoniphilus koenoeneniae TaxID=507751 RepID=A0ABU0AZT6_9FIRM|nr:hypothetical protein [Peptoniphilus koenoeneniae]MDQ0275480.1 hypothetical protein [Peptoniphilus koenoeneniae]